MVLSRSLIKKQRGRRPLLGLAVLGVLVGTFVIAGIALAVHDLQFQLDGDTKVSPVTNVGGHAQPLDWNSFFDSSSATSGKPLAGTLVNGFTAGAFSKDFQTTTKRGATVFATLDPTTFTTGSKDTLDINPGWQCASSNNVLSKNDIMNAYALAYTETAADPDPGHQILYFGLERNSNNGDANVAFWFLQDTVSCDSSNGTATFSGHHVDGDLLVVSAFTNGGGVSGIDVYRWNGGATGSLGTTSVGHGVDCISGTGTAGGDSLCATTNGGAPPGGLNAVITTLWPTANTSDGLGTTLQPSEFFEGGVDLTSENLGGHCFNTFVGDTRSSQSLTATIFDYALGTLGECSVSVTTTPSLSTTTLDSTTAITDLANISGLDGSGNAGPKPTGTMSFFLCGPGVTSCASPDGTAVSGNPVTLANCTPDVAGHSCATSGNVRSLVTATGTYCFRAVYDPVTDTNYHGQGGSFDGSNECFTVTAVASTSTEQRWLPNDKATVTAPAGAAVQGNVTWVLYVGSNNCTTGTGVTTVPFGPTDVDANGVAVTDNTTYYTSNKTVSWQATFHSTNDVGSGTASPCETSSIANYDNDITAP
jgi:hypothetical protein